MTSLEEPSTQFQKHNSKKRVIEKASHCLCHLVSIGRKGDQLCTANCLTLKLYQNKTNPGGQRLRPHPGPWPSKQAQCSWSNEVGTRAWVQQKQLQGSSECKGDAERLQPCGSGNRICLAGQGYEQKIHVWKNILWSNDGMQSVTRSNLREETFVCNFEKASSIIFILFLNITILRSLPEAPLLHRGSLHTSSFSPYPPIHSRFFSQTPRACESFALPLRLPLPCNCWCCTLPPSSGSYFTCSGALSSVAGPGARVGP